MEGEKALAALENRRGPLAAFFQEAWPEAALVRDALRAKRPAALTGVLRGARGPLAEEVIQSLGPGPGPLVLVTRTEEEAWDLAASHDPESGLWTFLPEEDEARRLAAWTEIYEGRGRVLAASVPALNRGAPAAEDLVDLCLRLAPGLPAEPETLCRGLLRAGFRRLPMVGGPGEFSLHGGILDVFPPGREDPVRVELWDETVKSLRSFDPADQRSRQRLDSLEIPPLRLDQGRDPGPLLGPGAWTLWIDPPAQGPGPGLPWLAQAWDAARAGRGFFFFSYGPPPLEGLEELHIPLRPSGFKRGRAEEAAALVERLGESGGKLWLGAPDPGEEQSAVQWLSRTAFPGEKTATLPSRVTEGFRLGGHWFLPGQEIFSRFPLHSERAEPRVSTRGPGLEDLSGLAAGDLVVHREHGIGRYEGLSHLVLAGREGDYVRIAYAEGHVLYVPAQGLAVLSPYDGGGRPRLFRLGGDAWLKVKSKARSALRDLAVEMIRGQAARSGLSRPPCGPDGPWMEDLKAAFPHAETPDQVRSWEEIQADMEGQSPMDRLVVGDVGFGKTELALRACFKAVAAGRQAAVLVPTTVLAEQHLETFKGRLQGLPVRLESLTRFQPRAAQTKILGEAAAGKVDILIGTHRILSGDLAFKNLGLLVVDEEHRFGVKDKERLKKMCLGVDVLSLSATPIPRSLHMSLSGIRGLSRLETPPLGRLPVRTYILEENPALLRQALNAELARGGQVFYIVGKIHRMEAKKEQIQALVPEARIGLVHGRLPARDLERAMLRFYHGEDDILLATTLVESGLDIPRVNTLIVSKADELGLAQLYQLRGRVGRSDVQARAYFLFDHPEALGEDAKKRLDVMEESAALGSGFKLALRDLEIRGAGNVLGKEQHGHLAALGYAAYCEILAEVAAEAQGRPPLRNFITEVDLPLDAFLPQDYLPEAGLRLDIYQRLSRAEGQDEVKSLAAELTDRFGPPPPEAETLLILAGIRVRAANLGVQRLRASPQEMILEFSAQAAGSPASAALLQGRWGRLRQNPSRPFQVRAARVEGRPLTEDLEELLTEMEKRAPSAKARTA